MSANGHQQVRLPLPANLSQLEPVTVFDVEKLTDNRTSTLKNLLQEGHVSVAPLRNPKLILHSHLPHLLGSAYRLGASEDFLEKAYHHEVASLLDIDDSFIRGDKISKEHWREHLADKSYTVAFVDFFDNEIKKNDGNWENILKQYLNSGPEPLIHGLIGGLGHPFIHLAYAFEFNSAEVASQAFSLACTEYIELHGLIDSYPPDNSKYKTTSLADVLEQVRVDTRFDGLIEHPSVTNIGLILTNCFDAVLEHWNAWEIVDPLQQLEQICDVSTLLAISTGDTDKSFDFYYIHLMTVAHALRVLWHHFTPESLPRILREYALFTILLYICQKRLSFGTEQIESVQVGNKGWDEVVHSALNHKWALDAHFFKVVCAPKVFAETYGSKDGFYLKAAIKFINEFSGWEGFGLGIEGFNPKEDGYKPE